MHIKGKLLSLNNKKSLSLVLIFLCVVFVFLRLFNIGNTFEFWGDIGRDHQKLIEWVQKGIPPLIGPNTSVLPILNQSAWFYYLIFPVFFITRSALSMTYSVILLTIVLFVISFFIQSKKNKLFILILFFLISIHPLIILQQRNPWNPSFSIPFLLFSISGVIRLLDTYSDLMLFLVILSLSFALGMTYSIFPVVAFLAYGLFLIVPTHKKIKYVFFGIASLLFVFLPNILFELRTHYFIDHFSFSLLTGSSSFVERLVLAQSFLFFGSRIHISPFLQLVGYFCFYLLLFWMNKSLPLFKKSFVFAVLATFFTAFFPFENSHYFFGLILMWFTVFSLTHKSTQIILLGFFAILWLNPFWLGHLFKPSVRNLSVIETCAKTFCHEHKNAYFVSSMTWYGSHSAHDHAFLLNKKGCKARDIVSNPSFKSNKMVVVADKKSFTPFKDSFYELEQFGAYKVISNFSCTKDIQYWLLER